MGRCFLALKEVDDAYHVVKILEARVHRALLPPCPTYTLAFPVGSQQVYRIMSYDQVGEEEVVH